MCCLADPWQAYYHVEVHSLGDCLTLVVDQEQVMQRVRIGFLKGFVRVSGQFEHWRVQLRSVSCPPADDQVDLQDSVNILWPTDACDVDEVEFAVGVVTYQVEAFQDNFSVLVLFMLQVPCGCRSTILPALCI